ncbi:GNAT family N-acetyltransferase [Planosporangium mesophilum]|uniref:N-acetyltransferase n=1 Tax=Planosporangium mesophilum TaxID=689768 RepID=A0A8J3WYV8_9ACTN|nr:GNAT family N-acetyltransferase [Planosporangium mesophilum]GII20569.1 N-acetyltransferase [Planosporangium mesophilum]
MGVTIRTAGRRDLDVVVELSAALFAEDAGQRDPYTDLDWPRREGHEYFGGLLTGPTTRCWLAEVDGVIAGCLVGRINRESTVRPVRTAELESMYVRPEYRGTGVGDALVAQFFEWARGRRAKRASVTAYASNDRAIAFYERNGFTSKSVQLELGL